MQVTRLVFVHGIGGPRDPAEELRVWNGALATGMRDAGHSEIASQLLCGRFDSKFAYYGDLFDRGQGQGGGVGVESEQVGLLLLELLVDLIDDLAEDEDLVGAESARDLRDADKPDAEERRKVLAFARAETVSGAQEQGVMGAVRRCLNVATTVLELKPWRRLGRWAAPKLMVRELAQVVRYLDRAELDPGGLTLDMRIRNRVVQALGDGPCVVVAHSLGTVVAWEALHSRKASVPLFTTLGSPISMRTAVWPRVLPQPPRTPECVRRWRNYYDRDDPIAVRPKLEKDIAPNSRFVRPKTKRVDSDGLWVHPATLYLAQEGVAGKIAEALTAEQGCG